MFWLIALYCVHILRKLATFKQSLLNFPRLVYEWKLGIFSRQLNKTSDQQHFNVIKQLPKILLTFSNSILWFNSQNALDAYEVIFLTVFAASCVGHKHSSCKENCTASVRSSSPCSLFFSLTHADSWFTGSGLTLFASVLMCLVSRKRSNTFNFNQGKKWTLLVPTSNYWDSSDS